MGGSPLFDWIKYQRAQTAELQVAVAWNKLQTKFLSHLSGTVASFRSEKTKTHQELSPATHNRP